MKDIVGFNCGECNKLEECCNRIVWMCKGDYNLVS